MDAHPQTYWENIWKKFTQHKAGLSALALIILFLITAIYAPLLASSKPLAVQFEGVWYFPLFRYLFYTGLFTKSIDLFYNILIFTFPLFILGWICLSKKQAARLIFILILSVFQAALFILLLQREPKDPAADPILNQQQEKEIQWHVSKGEPAFLSWAEELSYMTPYAKLNLLLHEQQILEQHRTLLSYQLNPHLLIPSLWQIEQIQALQEAERWESHLKMHPDQSEEINAKLAYAKDKRKWIEQHLSDLHFEWMPPLRHFHWEEDAGGDPLFNTQIPWWEQTRINGKDLSAALIFGTRTSLAVGILTILLSLAIGIPIGALAGYCGGRTDLFTCRLIEIWESMPTLFMLLMSISFFQTKSIFLVIGMIGLFGWTEFSRFIRGEFLKQKSLPYVEACRCLGFGNGRIMFSHLLPNALPPILTLAPFAIMGAISIEAALSFLGLGEEASASWGVLMDEGRSRFPAESSLLWPPAFLLTLLLVSIALVGDAFRDILDPKNH